MHNNKSSISKGQSSPKSDLKQGSVNELTQRNVELIRSLEESAKRERSHSDVIAEAIAKF